jgi:hypothetical protein
MTFFASPAALAMDEKRVIPTKPTVTKLELYLLILRILLINTD